MQKKYYGLLLVILCLFITAISNNAYALKVPDRKERCNKVLQSLRESIKKYQLKTNTVLTEEITPEKFEDYIAKIKQENIYITTLKSRRKECSYGISLDGDTSGIGYPYCTYHGSPFMACKKHYEKWKSIGSDIDYLSFFEWDNMRIFLWKFTPLIIFPIIILVSTIIGIKVKKYNQKHTPKADIDFRQH